MTDIENRPAVAVPPLFWVVGIVSVLWNSIGAYDYTMTQLRSSAYLANVAPGTIAWIDTFPAWATAAWALGVWASLIGALLFLARSRHAAAVYIVSLVGAVVSFSYQFTHNPPAVMRTGSGIAIPVVIVAAIVMFWWFARKMTARGVLA